MATNLRGAFIGIFVFLTLVQASYQRDEFVDVCDGRLRGTRNSFDDKTDLSLFFGIAYAKPPTGDLRFDKPQPSDPWEGTQDAIQPRYQCMQPWSFWDSNLRHYQANEDCLYLNIYAPSSRNEKLTSRKKAVIMFIHGGNFNAKTGALYNFTNVAVKDVLVVTINYRLGVFGFLSTGTSDIPGNYGLLDMAMALDWIRENIDRFGGDPGRITLMGKSAGATSVSMLMLSPLTRHKFHRAILHSGASISDYAIRDVASASEIFIDKLGCSDATSQLTCLRGKTAWELLNSSGNVDQDNPALPLWTPVVEKTFGALPDTPINLIRDPSLVPIPTIRGYTQHDGSRLITSRIGDSFKPFYVDLALGVGVYSIFGDKKGSQAYQKMYKEYNLKTLKYPHNYTTAFKIKGSTDLVTDLLFRYPTIREAILYSRRNGETAANTYVFRIDRKPSYRENAFDYVEHEFDLEYMTNFPQGPAPFSYNQSNERDQSTGDFVATLWTNFAKDANPTPVPVKNVMWTPFITDNPGPPSSTCNKSPFEGGLNYKILHVDDSSRVGDFQRCEKVNFWTEISTRHVVEEESRPYILTIED